MIQSVRMSNQPHPERRNVGLSVSEQHEVITLFSGDCYVTHKQSHMLVTILGSCVSACIRDPIIGVGGMNHFLLPDSGHGDFEHVGEATRYGAYAMEQLINGIINLGGVKSRLEIKLFGGGNVIATNTMIGDRNIAFVKQFLQREGLLVNSEDLGGNYPRRIHYYPDTGKVMMRNLRRKEDMKIVEEERKFASALTNKPIEGEVDLF